MKPRHWFVAFYVWASSGHLFFGLKYMGAGSVLLWLYFYLTIPVVVGMYVFDVCSERKNQP